MVLWRGLLEPVLLAEGEKLLGGGVVERREVDLPCRGD